MAHTQSAGWTRVARWLHWGMALAILVEVPAGYIMAWTYGPEGDENMFVHITASQIHHTTGMLIFAAVLFRLGWRFTHPAPPMPADASRLERALAHSVQFMLYGLLILIPITGYSAISTLADVAGFGPTHIWFFGHDGFAPDGMIPRLLPALPYDSPKLLTYSLFGPAHVWLVYFGGALLSLHILAALRHHFVLQNNILRRMMGRNISV